MAKTITSADAVFMLAITDLFPVPVKLQNFATDDAFTVDNVSPTETKMGVDGHLSLGYTPNPIKQKIKLAADSPSVAIFDAWFAAQQFSRSAYSASAILTLPGISAVYTFIRGGLTGYKHVPDAKKTLDPLEYEITWESVTGAAL